VPLSFLLLEMPCEGHVGEFDAPCEEYSHPQTIRKIVSSY